MVSENPGSALSWQRIPALNAGKGDGGVSVPAHAALDGEVPRAVVPGALQHHIMGDLLDQDPDPGGKITENLPINGRFFLYLFNKNKGQFNTMCVNRST